MKTITYLLPDNQSAQAFVSNFFKLLGVKGTQEVNLDKNSPQAYHPATYFSLSNNVSEVTVVFESSAIQPLAAGNIYLAGSAPGNCVVDKEFETSDFVFAEKKDEIGEYIKGSLGNNSYYWLSMEELCRRLANAKVVIDHTGVNIPTNLVSKEVWDTLISQLGKEAVLFDYPGEPWPFIVPATAAELAGEVTDLTPYRGPKFELVYDKYTPIPVIQLSLDTSLTKEEVHALFPGPYAETFPNLADFFRSVYIQSPWNNVAVRVDVNYASNTTEDGLLKYLVSEGERVK